MATTHTIDMRDAEVAEESMAVVGSMDFELVPNPVPPPRPPAFLRVLPVLPVLRVPRFRSQEPS